MSRRVLVVEDDEHKIEDIQAFWKDRWPNDELGIARSVREAVVAVYDLDFALIVLDMALPTFDQSAKASGGTSQPQGGLEVIRTLGTFKRNTNVIIFTQYDGIEIDGAILPIKDTPTILSKRYGVSVLSAIVYEYQSLQWRGHLEAVL